MRKAILILLLLIVASCSSNTEKVGEVKCIEEDILGISYTVQCYVIIETDNHRVAVNGMINTRTRVDEPVDVFIYVDDAEMQRLQYPNTATTEYLRSLVYNEYINEVEMNRIEAMLDNLYLNKLHYNKTVGKYD